MGRVSIKSSLCFSFSASQISRYDVSPGLRSTIFLSAFFLLKQRGADWSGRHRISETWFAMLGVRLSNTSWSSVRHCGVISLEIMCFVDCSTLSVCAVTLKIQSKFDNFGVFSISSCKRWTQQVMWNVYIRKNNFLNNGQYEIFGSFRCLHILLWFSCLLND